MYFPRFMYPLLVYRSLLVPFLVVSAIAVPCWVVIRLYRRRTSGHRPSLRRELLLVIFVVYLSGLASATLANNRPSRAVAESMAGVQLRPDPASLTCSSTMLPRGSTAQSFCARNAGGNVALFVPLGILLLLVWRRLRFWSGLLTATAFSVGIEVLQLVSRAWGSHRLADINDVILNVLGAALGLALMSTLRTLRRARRREPSAEGAHDVPKGVAIRRQTHRG